MTELAVEPDELHEIYLELAEKIFSDEQFLQDSLPIEETAGVSTHLSEVVDRWRTAHKSLRTLPVANVYACEPDDLLDSSITRVLVGLDAEVNVLDDIIDTKDLTTEQRVALTANAAFSSLLITEYCPPAHRGTLSGVLREYFTALFQIPLVESQLLERVQDAETPSTRREACIKIYSYRARDIDAFARIPALLAELDEDPTHRLLSDLRAYRARRLLFKDIHDVSRDLADNDMTPVIALLNAHDSIDLIETEVKQIYDHFEYTTTGYTRYGNILGELEDAPDVLSTLLQDQQNLVREASD